ncbi:potassium uptake TrkH family protein [Melghirimyces profundicolus]|uniref:Potassium uptake TrkH family protein n=1 Tax=Melghirimyces profundicolus TaxID=1242148 RepID=A0A2T6BGT2_9BACL|nr:TrkH family potassium uptake protein [Melghirimyces profundicolus]PTX55251.1 potassium uptake TrkH family protein [Melghirimyces profundicolus]
MKLKKVSPAQLLFFIYLSAAAVSSILLYLPFSHKPGVDVDFLDALFTAVSAISVTGLTVVNTAETFSPVGVFLLMVMNQFGGIGFMTLSTFLWMATGQRIGIQRRQMIMLDQNRSDLSGLVRLMRDLLVLSLAIEAVGALILGTYFYFSYPYGKNAFLYGIFSSISAFTNAGFDIFGNSLIGFSEDYIVQSVNIALMVAGGIGFPVLMELKEWFLSGNRRNFRFSLFTKITVTTYFVLLILGTGVLWLLETPHFYADQSWHRSFFYSLFNSVTARSGGLATMDINEYTTPSQLFLSFLMFIGASPSSVGGGIRTTTLAVVALAVYNYARGQRYIRVFRRELLDEDVRKASVVFSTGVLLLAVSVFLVSVEQPQHTLMEVMFEVSSAFGTCGLSMGITPELTAAGKISIMVLMFMGRIGILVLLFLLRRQTPPETYHYPRERVIIG